MYRIRKNLVAKTVSKLLAAALTVTACLSGSAIPACGAGHGKNGGVRDMTSQQIVEDMGLGYNIGNTFDSIGSFITTTDPWEYQKGWGNDPVTKQFIQKIKQGGFKTVRFPVSWAQWIDSSNRIDPGYMNAVQTVVDWCMEEDLYVILNIHHDSGAADTSWVRRAAVDWDWTSKRYEAVWTQISENFKNYGDHLIFEGMNEVEFPAAPSMSKQYELLNSMNQLFVDTVRKTGGNNASRHLLIPGYNTDIRRTCDRRYHFPNDPAGHCILSIHYYSPSPFCVAEHDVDWAVPVTTWGSEEDIQAVEADLNMLAEKFITKGTPVIIGEYGVLTEDNKEKESIRRYLSTVPEIIMEYGMCPILWDTSNAGDMKTLERVSGEFYDPVIGQNYKALAQKKAAGQIAKRTFDFPVYKRVVVPASPNGVVSLASYSSADILGISFTLTCDGDWDSYGGGGIVIEGLDKAIDYQFNSVFDEVVHIFTPEEKAKLRDQLTVAIWWTDETGGGSRRELLSLENGQVTLLYKGDKNAQETRTASTGSGGSGGSGGGASRNPNYSTAGVGGNGTVPEHTGTYRWSMTEEQCDAHESREHDLSLLCEGYETGDTVRITLSSYCNKGYGLAMGANAGGEFISKETGRDNPEITLEVTPDSSIITVTPYWAEKRAGGILYNLKAEVVKKAPRTEGFDVIQNEASGNDDYPRDIKDAYKVWNVKKGKRVKVTIYAQEPENGIPAKGKVWFVDENGAKIEGDIAPGTNPILIGTPKEETLYFSSLENLSGERSSRGAGELAIHISNIRVEQLPDDEAKAELLGSGRAIFEGGLIVQAAAAEQEESGLKLYYQCSDGAAIEDIQGQIVINNDWNRGQQDKGTNRWTVGRDADGTPYIWFAWDEAVNSVLTARWDNGKGSWKIRKLVALKADSEEEFEAFEVTADKPVEGYSLAELRQKAGIAKGERIRITVSTEAAAEFSGTVTAKDTNGNTVTGTFGSSGIVIGEFMEDTIRLSSEDNPYTVTGIQIQKAPGTGIAQFEKAGRIEFANSLIETKESEDSEASGLKIYYEYGGDIDTISANVVVNGDWNYKPGTENWATQEDSDGTYIWYPCDSVNSVMLACWYTDISWKITKLVHVKKEEVKGPEIKEPDPEEGEIVVSKNADGHYEVPKKQKLTAIRFTTKSGNGANVSVDNTSINDSGWGYLGYYSSNEKIAVDTGDAKIKWVNIVNDTEDDVDFVYFKCVPLTANPKEGETTIEQSEDGNFYVKSGYEEKLKTIRFTTVNGNGANIAYDGGYLGWCGNDSEYTIDTSKGPIEYITITPGDNDEIEFVYFAYDETTRSKTLRKTVKASERVKVDAILSGSDIETQQAERDEDNIYHIPEEIGGSLVGIMGELSSEEEEVTLILDKEISVTPMIVDGKLYYFFKENNTYSHIRFRGQEVENVEFIYREKEEEPKLQTTVKDNLEGKQKEDVKAAIPEDESDDGKDEEKVSTQENADENKADTPEPSPDKEKNNTKEQEASLEADKNNGDGVKEKDDTAKQDTVKQEEAVRDSDESQAADRELQTSLKQAAAEKDEAFLPSELNNSEKKETDIAENSDGKEGGI